MADMRSDPATLDVAVLPDVDGMARTPSGQAIIGQVVSGAAPKGRTRITFSAIAAPTESEIQTEERVVGGPSGGPPTIDDGLESTPIYGDADLAAIRVDSLGGSGEGDSTLAADTLAGAVQITVSDPANFVAGDYIYIGSSGDGPGGDDADAHGARGCG